MIQIGDRVQVGSRIGADPAWAVVVNILPAIGDRVTMYCVRFDVPTNRDGRRAEINGAIAIADPKPNECWIDEGVIYGPFIDQNIGWNN
jgi:hypothetical protein